MGDVLLAQCCPQINIKRRVHCISTMAAAQPLPSVPGFADLPDDLLVACFERLEGPLERCAALIAVHRLRRGGREELEPSGGGRLAAWPPPADHPCCSLFCRRRVLPLVCSRWRRLSDDPQLLRCLSLEFNGSGSLSRLAAFRRWLGAGAALHSLRLEASPIVECDDDYYSITDLRQLHRDMFAHIPAACSGLRELRIQTWQLRLPDIDVGNLAATLPSLRVLRLHAVLGARLLVLKSLGHLSNLHELRLEGDSWQLQPAAALPPALTRLDLSFCQLRQAVMPAQVCAHLRLMVVVCTSLAATGV